MKFYFNLIYRDIKRNKVISITLGVFLLLAFTLMASGLRLTGVINSSMTELEGIAKTPDYLQLHKGDYEEVNFENFVEEHSYIEDFITVEMINIDNSTFYFNESSFENVLMDNSFITQNTEFDFILDLNNSIANITQGEIGVPVYYHLEFDIQVGDRISIITPGFEKDFIVSTIIRDSQMNAALTSSKRFLIHQVDFDEIQSNYGSMEYSFQFLLNEGVSTSTLENDYKNANLPSNGVGISKSILDMLNSISYGLTGYLIILTSIILIIIGLLCLNYIIKSTLFDEQGTLGELKAIGLANNKITKLYVLKYASISILSAIFGYFISIPTVNQLSASVILYCGEGQSSFMIWISPLIGISILLLLVYLRSRYITKKMLKYNVVSLKRKTISQKKEGKYVLNKSKRIKNINIIMVLGELKCKWKEFILISFVFILSSFLIVIPASLLQTFNNPSFIKYMGVGESDIRVDLQYNENLETQVISLEQLLSGNNEVSEYEIYQVGSVQLITDSSTQNVRITNGDFNVFPIEYLEGRAPQNNTEIAFSYLYQDEFGFQVNDTVDIRYKDSVQTFKVVGIYQDITYGGKTAKAYIDFESNDTEVFIAYINLSNSNQIDSIINQIKTAIPGSKVTPVEQFVQQTLGGISESLKMVRLITTIIALALISAITALVVQLMISKEHTEIATKKSLGFTDKTIRYHYAARVLIILLITIFIATILSGMFGELLLSIILGSMGATKITLLQDSLTVYLFNPIIQLTVVVLTVIASTQVIKKYHIKDQIME